MLAAVPTFVKNAQPMPDPKSERELEHALGLAGTLVAQARQRSIAFALSDLGDIDLPEAFPATADDQALIRAIATLYLASQLELAGLVPAVETLCGAAVSGGLQMDLGAAADLVAHFWKGRNERFHQSERHAFFTRLFGAESTKDLSAGQRAINAAFEETMISLCEALYKLEERALSVDYGGAQAEARVSTAARGVAANLLARGTGIAGFAAQEIVTTIQECIQILRHPAIQHAFMERSVWGVVRATLTRYGRAAPDLESYVRRGKAGLVVLSWLADSLPALSAPVPVNASVIGAAEDWLESSLAVRETAAHGAAGG